MNLTLLGQMGTFAVLVFFVWRFLWGPLTRLLAERAQKVQDGLAAAERGHHELKLMQAKAIETMKQARAEAAAAVALAEQQALRIIEEARRGAQAEGERLILAAREEIQADANRAREQLRAAVAQLAVAGAGRILEREIDPADHARLIDSITDQLITHDIH